MKIILTITLLVCLHAQASVKIGKGIKYHAESTNSLTRCKLSIAPNSTTLTNAVDCKNCLRNSKD